MMTRTSWCSLRRSPCWEGSSAPPNRDCVVLRRLRGAIDTRKRGFLVRYPIAQGLDSSLGLPVDAINL